MLMWLMNLGFAGSEPEVVALNPYSQFFALPQRRQFDAIAQKVEFDA